MKALFTTLCCCSLLASASIASAEGVHSAHADALVHQGEVLLAAHKVVAACAKFEASEAQETGLGTLLHLGDCYERSGRSASAWHAFLEAEALATAQKDASRQQIAADRVAALEPKLSRVVFVVPTTSRVPGLTVRLGENTIPAASWGAIIPVDAGEQHVTVSAKGHRSWQLDLTVEPETREYRVNVPTLKPDTAPNADRRSALRTAGVITGGAGIAGLGAGAVFSALSRSADDAGTCVRGVIQCAPTRTTKNSYSDAATVTFALGGTLLATGITLWVLSPAPDNKEKNAPLRVAARVAGSGGRLQLEGVW
ncbi:MAG: hypothetical protein ABI488_16970 [Polyangiaceae bacterium]